MYLRRFQLMLQLQANQRRVWSQHKKQQPENLKQTTSNQSNPIVKETRK